MEIIVITLIIIGVLLFFAGWFFGYGKGTGDW